MTEQVKPEVGQVWVDKDVPELRVRVLGFKRSFDLTYVEYRRVSRAILPDAVATCEQGLFIRAFRPESQKVGGSMKPRHPLASFGRIEVTAEEKRQIATLRLNCAATEKLKTAEQRVIEAAVKWDSFRDGERRIMGPFSKQDSANTLGRAVRALNKLRSKE